MSATTRASRREYASDVAFTPAVKTIQEQKGSRKNYARLERSGDLNDGHPGTGRVPGRPGHVLPWHRQRRRPALHPSGGPPGFLKVDEQTSASPTSAATAVDHARQSILKQPGVRFLMDYANRRRIKLWGARASSRTPRPAQKTPFPSTIKSAQHSAANKRMSPERPRPPRQ